MKSLDGLPRKDPLAYDKAMKRIILIAIALTVIFTDNGYAFDKKGSYEFHADTKCSEFLDAYSKTTFEGKSTFGGSHDYQMYTRWISGHISAYNMYINNGKSDVLGNMTLNNVDKWLASWCRDNMIEQKFGDLTSKYFLSDAVKALIFELDPSSAKALLRILFNPPK